MFWDNSQYYAYGKSFFIIPWGENDLAFRVWCRLEM